MLPNPHNACREHVFEECINVFDCDLRSIRRISARGICLIEIEDYLIVDVGGDTLHPLRDRVESLGLGHVETDMLAHGTGILPSAVLVEAKGW